MTQLPDAAAATRPRPFDAPPARVGVLDVARGIAILGTLATNIWIFTDPGGIIGYLERPLPSLTGGLDQAVQTIARQLANAKFLGMLTLMFGIGLELQRRSAQRRGRPWPGRYAWRASLLFLDGGLHHVLVAGRRWPARRRRVPGRGGTRAGCGAAPAGRGGSYRAVVLRTAEHHLQHLVLRLGPSGQDG